MRAVRLKARVFQQSAKAEVDLVSASADEAPHLVRVEAEALTQRRRDVVPQLFHQSRDPACDRRSMHAVIHRELLQRVPLELEVGDHLVRGMAAAELGQVFAHSQRVDLEVPVEVAARAMAFEARLFRSLARYGIRGGQR